MAPCLALQALALVTFVLYCFARRQTGRAVWQTLILLCISLMSVCALGALMRQGQAGLPVSAYGLVAEAPAVAWMIRWGLALIACATIWSSVLGYFERASAEYARDDQALATS